MDGYEVEAKLEKLEKECERLKKKNKSLRKQLKDAYEIIARMSREAHGG